MKKLSKVLLVVAMLGIGLNSCKKEEVPSEIPGMGNSASVLEAQAYDFHEDLVIGPIIGVGEKNTKSAPVDDVVIQGVAQGSGQMVTVTLTITNTNKDYYRSVYLRAGTVFGVDQPGYQNGILLAPVVICLSPLETRYVTLYLYCINKGKIDSDNSATYEILGVTTSELMLELVNALEGKMVNFEHYMLYFDGDGALAGEAYDAVIVELQEIIWHITNGGGMTDVDKLYVKNLPNLPQGVYPEGIYDLNYVLPASWCDGCSLETAWGGTSAGARKDDKGAWWYYYDNSVGAGGKQAIYAGKDEVDGAFVQYLGGGVIIIELGNSLSLIDWKDPVKIQGYNDGFLPTEHPTPGLFTTYKGTALTVTGIGNYDYYAIHLDVKFCR